MTHACNGDRPHLKVEKSGPIVYLTMDRPETHNAISVRMMVELAEAWTDFDQDKSLRVAVLTGAGERAFCSGADLADLIPLLTGDRPARDEWDRRLLGDRSIYDAALLRRTSLYKPVITAVNGMALGGGSELLIASDLRIASRDATIGLTEVKWGFIPGGGALTRLPRQIPWCMAMEIFLTGEPISAEEAHRVGLVNRVVAAYLVAETAERLARAIAGNAPLAVRKAKEAVMRTTGLPLVDAFAIEDECAELVGASDDAKEGPRAFVAKRAPVFTGR
jgi:enoyl-CoA hydratase